MHLNFKQNQIIMHIDMNSYFASVEQQANPFLRGKSVAVCAYNSPNSVIIASSLEAKAKGIKTGCKVINAMCLDPNIHITQGEHDKYRSTSQKIFKILRQYSDVIEIYSIDEAFLDLTKHVKNLSEAEVLAKQIQDHIKKEVGEVLHSSVGLSWTKFLAKFAGDIAPKRSVIVIDSLEKIDELIIDRPLKDACGINAATEKKLRSIGIRNLYDLKHYDASRIIQKMKKSGFYLWANLNGLETSKVSSEISDPKSIGHSYCIPRQTTDKEYLAAILFKLCEKTGRRLRQAKLEACCISFSLTCVDGSKLSKSSKVSEQLFITEDIFTRAEKFLNEFCLASKVRIVAVSVSHLRPISGQLSLFPESTIKKDLSQAMDKVNYRYGEFTVMRGHVFNTDNLQNFEENKIAFRKT